MNYYKEPDTVSKVNGKFVLNDGECNINLGVLEGVLNTRDGKALAHIYETYVVKIGTLDTEGAVFEMRRGLV